MAKKLSFHHPDQKIKNDNSLRIGIFSVPHMRYQAFVLERKDILQTLRASQK
jgi:hypothetical protein